MFNIKITDKVESSILRKFFVHEKRSMISRVQLDVHGHFLFFYKAAVPVIARQNTPAK